MTTPPTNTSSAAAPKKSSGLGRGLGSLIPSAPPRPNAPTQQTVASSATSAVSGAAAPLEVGVQVMDVPPGATLLQIPLGKISPNPQQPRLTFGHQELEDLMNSIGEHGILQPLTVTKKPNGEFELIAGERRFRAAKMLGLETVPAIVRDADTEDKLVLALIENIQRENLNALEEAKGYRQLIDDHGFTQEQVAKKVGKARPTVANMLRLLDLPREIQDAIAVGTLPAGSARAILALPDAEQQLKFFHSMMKEKVSTREVESRIRTGGNKSAAKDPSLAGVEDQLREALGARVEVKKKNGQGAITISFYSESELASVVKKLLRVQSEE